MNKQELITSIAAKSEFTKKDSEIMLNAFLKTVEEVVASGDKLQLMGHLTIGTRYTKAKAESLGVNPQDPQGEKIVRKAKPEQMSTFVKIGKTLKTCGLEAPIVK